MKFETITGSLYEVDLEIGQVRRLVGAKDPTPRQGKDGEWKKYKSCTPIEVGSSVGFIWEAVAESMFDDRKDYLCAKTTLTSPVRRILETNN